MIPEDRTKHGTPTTWSSSEPGAAGRPAPREPVSSASRSSWSLVPLEDEALEDEALGKALTRTFRNRGIDVRTGSRVQAVDQDADHAEVVLDGGEVLTADAVLVVIGRKPNTAGLGLEQVGVGADRGWVVADDRLRTTAESVWAVGDLVNGPQLAHRGFAHGIFVAEEIAHMIGDRMGEQIAEAALLVGWEATAEDAALYVRAHPTQNEALGEAALSPAGKPCTPTPGQVGRQSRQRAIGVSDGRLSVEIRDPRCQLGVVCLVARVLMWD